MEGYGTYIAHYIAVTKHRCNLKEKIFTLVYSSGNTIHNKNGGTVVGTQTVELAP